jgi:hypothetical protein
MASTKNLVKNVLANVAQGAAGIGGGLAARGVSTQMLATMNPLLRGAIMVAAGSILPALSPKSKMLASAGVGITTVGGMDIAGKLLPDVFSPGTAAAPPVTGIASLEEDGVISDSEFEGWISGTETAGAAQFTNNNFKA